MSTGSDNPPLPGKGITPSNPDLQQVEPPFTRAALGGEIKLEPIRPQHNLNLKFGPDGSAVQANEIQRQQALADRGKILAAQLEQEKAGPRTRDTERLRDDYDRSRER